MLRYFLRLGTSGFGGPIAVVGYMQRDLVEQRGWIAREDFLNGVALGQTMPGPVVITAAFIGYLVAGLPGAIIAAVERQPAAGLRRRWWALSYLPLPLPAWAAPDPP